MWGERFLAHPDLQSLSTLNALRNDPQTATVSWESSELTISLFGPHTP